MSERKSTIENRKHFLDMGLNILIQQGYNHTGIKQIVDEVGVPKGSFYNYFDSKEQFGVEVIQHYAQQMRAGLDQALIAQDIDAFSALKQYFSIAIIMFQDKHFREGCLVGNLAAELADTNEVIRLALASVFADWEIPTTALLTQAQGEGTVRSDIPAEALASFLWNTFEGALLRMKVEKAVEPLAQWFTYMLEDFVLPK